MTHPATNSARPIGPSILTFSWLLHLRWGVVAGQTLLLLIAYFFLGIEIPVPIVAAIILFEVGSNLYFFYLRRRMRIISERLLAAVMYLDVILLTVLLGQTGGPMNPFTFLYLLHVVIGAILMGSAWAWLLAALTISCYASFFLPLPLAFLCEQLPFLAPGAPGALCPGHLDPSGTAMDLHLRGMWVAFAITATLSVFFIGRIQQALARHQETSEKLRAEKIKSEKFASLATLAAGAAHEFATPLATIAVAAGEMLHQLREGGGEEELLEDVTLIRQQVAKCKEILFQMAADTGEHHGEPLKLLTVAELLQAAMALLPPSAQARLAVKNEAGELALRVPLRALTTTLKGVIKNGLEASEDQTPVSLRAWRDERYLYIAVKDQGGGMSAETAARAREPFYSNKEGGLGLGLYLANSVVDRFGGQLQIQSAPQGGTTVTLSFARAQIEGRQ